MAGGADFWKTLIISTPAWLRAIVLLILTGTIVGTIIVVCFTILGGQEVTMKYNELHIAARQNVLIENCKVLGDKFPASIAPAQQNLTALIAQRDKLFGIINQEHNTQSSSGSNGNAASDMIKAQGEVVDMNKQIQAVQQSIDSKHNELMTVCGKS